jgi:ornithine carbamoyltransferase
MNNFIELADFTADQLRALLDRALADKRLFEDDALPASCPRKTLAMYFEKPSLRTRVSFEVAMTHLGGSAIYLTPADIGLGTREPVQDVARVLGRMCDAIMGRTFSHELMRELADHSPVPVINGLTDYSHPCQAMADLMTAMESFGDPAGRSLVFVGDGNNVARSLAVLCAKLGVRFCIACPEGYELEAGFLDGVQREHPGSQLEMSREPASAVRGADVIYTDTWVSMGQEDEKAKRVADFKAFQVNDALLAEAPDRAIVLHCLPAYRGYEITDAAFERHAEPILRQAANRLHFQRSLLNVLITDRRL